MSTKIRPQHMDSRISPTFAQPPATKIPYLNWCGTQKNCLIIHALRIPMASYKRAISTRGPKERIAKLCRVIKKLISNIPKARTLSGSKAGTILENIRLGTVILITIWLAPWAATVGKISSLVITKPQVTQNTLKNCFVDNGWDELLGQYRFQIWDVQADKRTAWYPDEGTQRRH